MTEANYAGPVPYAEYYQTHDEWVAAGKHASRESQSDTALIDAVNELTKKVDEMSNFLEEIKEPIRLAIDMFNNHPVMKVRRALGKK